MSVMFMYPGQGGQRVGMLDALPDCPEVESTLKEARDVLGTDPLILCSAGALESTTSVQLSLLVAGVAMTRTLLALGAAPDLVAGHSVGAWSAAVGSGALGFEEALGLVRLRGQLMEAAYPSGYGMAVIIGLSLSVVDDIAERVRMSGLPAYVANVNAEHQIVVAGNEPALALAQDMAARAGATNVARLAMTVPSHCELLSSQALTLAKATAKVRFERTRVRYISGTTARVLFASDALTDDLAWNMARQVNWHDTIRHAYERGARLVVGMPAGGALARLATSTFGDGGVIDSDVVSPRDIAARVLRYRETEYR